MLKAKYKAHKLINVIFYIIVFLIGFYMGIMGQKIGVKELFNKFLFIDNVYAYSYDCNSGDGCFSTPSFGNNGTWKDVDYIQNMFKFYSDKYNLNVSLSEYRYLVAYTTVNASTKTVDYFFSRTSFTSKTELTSSDAIKINYNDSFKDWNIQSYTNLNYTRLNWTSIASSQEELNPEFYIDLSNFYVFNENLFVNNENFKQVCVNPKDVFLVTSSTSYDNKRYFGDYIWFPYNIAFLRQGRYNSEKYKLIFDEISSSRHLFFNSLETFSSFDSDTGLGLMEGYNGYLTSSYPYNDRFNYYGWSAYPFLLSNYLSDSPDIPAFQFSENFGNIYY